MTTFIERMQLMANDKEEVQKTLKAEYDRRRDLRKEQLFVQLTFKYYDKIKNAIENASKHGRQFAYMNFDREDFKANFNGLGNPAQFQRLWLIEMCNPNSKYLIIPNWNTGSVFGNVSDVRRKDSFEGLNFDVWNNKAFTTVFSWDLGVSKENLYCYHSRNWKELYPND